MRVRFSVDMNPRRRNPEALNSAPKKERVYESPHKLYVGNLPRDVKPEYLRDHFSQFGTLLSARVLHDQKAGKNRCYGFLSFSSPAERDAAISLNGTVESSSTTTESCFFFHVILCLSYLLHLFFFFFGCV
jgi:RNA recognition motif-containing protein